LYWDLNSGRASTLPLKPCCHPFLL
jgi:hypothetical protein